MSAVMAAVVLTGCGERPSSSGSGSEGHPDSLDIAATETNRVAIPSSVRTNLGIGFVNVERRSVERTLRAPGRFEYLPSARREYRTMLPGRVELFVTQFDRVEAGDLIYTIESPQWREMQRDLAEVTSSIQRATTKLETLGPLGEAHQSHRESLEQSILVWKERIDQLEEVRQAGGSMQGEFAEARASLSSAQAELAEVREKQAEIEASWAETHAELIAKRIGLDLLLDSAETLTGFDRIELEQTTQIDGRSGQMWHSIRAIRVNATESGVVESTGVTNGAWTDQSSPVVTVVKPEKLRFHAVGMQSDLGVLQDGLLARIVSPTTTVTGRGVSLTDSMSGVLKIGLSGHARDRTIDLYVVPDELLSWARAGVAAQLEIVTDPSRGMELSIPMSAVQRDGLTPVIFRRDPMNPDDAIRIEADLGANDGRWIEVLSGLRDGDEIVLDGAFQLMLATSGSAQKGGHFHTDGTFHDGED
jgi:multidrug efflux pump subunit AcrA (membrane-fusion protein)